MAGWNLRRDFASIAPWFDERLDPHESDSLKSVKNLIANGLVRYRWYWKPTEEMNSTFPQKGWRKALELISVADCKDVRKLLDANRNPSITYQNWDWHKRAADKWYKYEHIGACALVELTATESMIVHANNKKEIKRAIRAIEMIASLGFSPHGHMGFLELSVLHMGTGTECFCCSREISTSKRFECACCDKIWCANCRGPGDFLEHSDYGLLCRGECEELYQF